MCYHLVCLQEGRGKHNQGSAGSRFQSEHLPQGEQSPKAALGSLPNCLCLFTLKLNDRQEALRGEAGDAQDTS